MYHHPPSMTIAKRSPPAPSADAVIETRDRLEQRYLDLLSPTAARHSSPYCMAAASAVSTLAANRTTDTKFFDQWARFIAGGVKTVADFDKMVFQSKEYDDRTIALLRGTTIDVLGPDATVDPRTLHEFIRDRRGVETRLEDVRAFVYATPAFRDKYEAVIRSCARSVSVSVTVPVNADGDGNENEKEKRKEERGLTDADVARLLDNFRQYDTPTEYDLDALSRDIIAIWRAKMTGGDAHEGGGGERTTVHAHAQAETGANEAHTEVGLSGKSVEEAGSGETLADLERMLEDFISVFGRPMFVQEYLHFYFTYGGGPKNRRGKDNDNKDWHALFSGDFQRYVAVVNTVREVYRRFLGTEPTDYQIVTRNMPLFVERTTGAQEAAAQVTATVTSTDAYRNVMLSGLYDEFTRTFGETLVPDDAERLFRKVRQHAVGLADDRVRELVNAFKQETDVLMNQVYDTYLNVLGRGPEREELDEHIQHYRRRLDVYGEGGRDGDGGELVADDTAGEEVMTDKIDDNTTVSALNRELENRLIGNLEFHDVLKTLLRERHIAKNGVSMTAGALYGSLAAALKRMQHLPDSDKNMDGVRRVVHDLVT